MEGTDGNDGVIEICFLERGRQIYTFASGSVHRVLGGDVLVAQPGEVHGTGLLPEFPGRLYWIQIRVPRRDAGFLGLNAGETATLITELLQLCRQFRGSTSLRDQFENALATERLAEPRLRAIAFKTRLVELLLTCIEASARSEERSLPHPIARSLRSLEKESSGLVSISELARSARVSESYFKALFRRAMGMPPPNFYDCSGSNRRSFGCATPMPRLPT